MKMSAMASSASRHSRPRWPAAPRMYSQITYRSLADAASCLFLRASRDIFIVSDNALIFHPIAARTGLGRVSSETRRRVELAKLGCLDEARRVRNGMSQTERARHRICWDQTRRVVK